MGKLLLTKASLAAAEKRVKECINHICEAQVGARLKAVKEMLKCLYTLQTSMLHKLLDT